MILLTPSLIWIVPVFICAFHVFYDNLWPEDHNTQQYNHTGILNLFLFLHLPASMALMAVLLWQITPGDLMGMGKLLDEMFHFNILDIHEQLGWIELVSISLVVGFMLSTNTIVGHELTHRTNDKLSMIVGRWVLAIVGDAQFSISHVYGHHVNVGTENDSVTAKRGESLYRFTLRSSLGQYSEAWIIEKNRLGNKNQPVLSLQNRVITGLLMTAAIVVLFIMFAGWFGLLAFCLHFLVAKFLYEAVNYIEHYGLVREVGKKVESRHSWDCNTRAATYVLFSLSRHSDHHANATRPFWEVEAQTNSAATIRHGYIAQILVASFPPLWHRYITPQLLQWDQKMATIEERRLVQKANLSSKIEALVLSTQNAPTNNGTI